MSTYFWGYNFLELEGPEGLDELVFVFFLDSMKLLWSFGLVLLPLHGLDQFVDSVGVLFVHLVKHLAHHLSLLAQHAVHLLRADA